MDTYSGDISLDCCYLGQSDNCYQFKMSVLLLYSRGVSPRIPLNLMMSQHPHGIFLHSLILISQSVISLPVSQSAFSSQLRPCPHRLQNCRTCHASFILTLTSRKTTSTALNHSLHPLASNKTLSATHVSLCVIIHSIQGTFVHLSPMHINPWILHCLLLQ